ncbi:hypothetical protein, partial [Escherichia coli]|uniref:hypothetical protein n=1 Tax=Escherichia coli TaxID=562 RepID=UPI001BC84A05
PYITSRVVVLRVNNRNTFNLQQNIPQDLPINIINRHVQVTLIHINQLGVRLPERFVLQLLHAAVRRLPGHPECDAQKERRMG